jgi:hypothetical protein
MIIAELRAAADGVAPEFRRDEMPADCADADQDRRGSAARAGLRSVWQLAHPREQLVNASAQSASSSPATAPAFRIAPGADVALEILEEVQQLAITLAHRVALRAIVLSHSRACFRQRYNQLQRRLPFTRRRYTPNSR